MYSKEYSKFYKLLDKSENEASDYIVTLNNSGYGVNARCPHCGTYLLKSDLPRYHSVCLLCDENFYKCEEVSIKEDDLPQFKN